MVVLLPAGTPLKILSTYFSIQSELFLGVKKGHVCCMTGSYYLPWKSKKRGLFIKNPSKGLVWHIFFKKRKKKEDILQSGNSVCHPEHICDELPTHCLSK